MDARDVIEKVPHGSGCVKFADSRYQYLPTGPAYFADYVGDKEETGFYYWLEMRCFNRGCQFEGYVNIRAISSFVARELSRDVCDEPEKAEE